MKKIYILIIILLVLAVCFFIVINIGKNIKISKANKIFGVEKCNCEINPGYDLLTYWECKVCGYKEAGNSAVSQICDECAKITVRCNRCGNLK